MYFTIGEKDLVAAGRLNQLYVVVQAVANILDKFTLSLPMNCVRGRL